MRRRSPRRTGVVAAAVLLLFAAAPLGGRAAPGARQEDATIVLRGPGMRMYAPAAARELAERLLASAVDALPLPGFPAGWWPGGDTVDIHLVADEAAFDALTGGQVPEWGAGVALPFEGRIVLPLHAPRTAAMNELARILKHELAHVGLQRRVGRAAVPRWFSEGYATWAAGELDPAAGWMLRVAFLTGSAPSLDELTLAWPRGTSQARVAYLLAADAVRYLAEQGGGSGFGPFLERWRATGSFEQAMRATYAVSSTQFERLWLERVRSRYGWLVFLAQSVVLWAFLAVLVVALTYLRRRRNRERLERLRASELPDRPAYWLGEDPGTAPPPPPPSGQPPP
ncbi:MAG: hypothetical protein WEB88_14250 [Gemmatimonadota bacterium]